MRRLVQRQQTLPIGGGIRPVDDLRVIKPVIAPGNELRMQIRDLATFIGKDRVVGLVGLKPRHLQERRVINRSGSQKRLLQRRHRRIH